MKLYNFGENSAYQHCVVVEPFRLFYNLSGDDKTPKKLDYADAVRIPDYVTDLIKVFYHAYNIYINIYKLNDPLKKGIYYEKGAKFIDIMLTAIPTQKGLVAAELVDNSALFKGQHSMQGDAIRVLLDNNLIKKTATPIHELFHIFQYSYSSFNNMWFMEGLARWAQNITHNRADKYEALPQNLDELEILINKTHDAEYFWKRLITLVGDEKLFINSLLKYSSYETSLVEKKFGTKERYIKNSWSKEEKKNTLNNKYIFSAIVNAVKDCMPTRNEELDEFLTLISKNSETQLERFDTLQIQRFLKVLQLNHNEFINEFDSILYCEYYDVETKTLNIPKLNCVDLSEYELDCLNAVENLKGDLIISSKEIKHLNSFNYLRSVENLCITDMQNLESINGFNSLERINSLEISKNELLEEINGFNILFRKNDTVDDFIKITHNKKLQNIRFLKNLRVVKSSFYLHHNALTNLKGLEGLEYVGASFSLSSNKLDDLSALSKLNTVKGMLGIAYNNLSTLNGLENLQKIYTTKWNAQNRTIAIHNNPDLYDISALENLQNDEDYYLIISIDSYTQYKKKPSLESNFHKNILELYEKNTNKFIPTYKFATKPAHDYKNFGKTTHSLKLSYMFDFEVESDILIISFSGFNGWLGGVFNSRYPYIIDEMKTNKIFIMDKKNSWFHNGIEGVTKNIQETITLLKEITDEKKYSKILCIGASMGGYMALLCGKILGATNIVAFSPQSFLDTLNREKHSDIRWEKELEKLNKSKADKEYFDLEPLYREPLDENVNIEIHYSKDIKLDELHALHLKSKKVKLIAHDDCDHYIAVCLHKKGVLEELILKNLSLNIQEKAIPKKSQKKLKILFADKWQKAVLKCDWLDAYHINFKKIKEVIKYAKENDIKVLFANNYATQSAILKHNDLLLQNGLKFIVNNKKALRDFVDKQKFYDIMIKNNMSNYVPKYYMLDDDIKFPCMVKTKTGGAGRGVYLAYSKKDITKVDENSIISEYLPSNTEYATSIFYKNGKILKEVTFSKTADKEVYVLQQESKKNIQTKKEETQFLDIFRDIIEIFSGKKGYCQCSINYKIQNGIPKIFEINPRIGYTLAGFCDEFKGMMDIYINEVNTRYELN
ncbi:MULTISPECIES: hypothetical protein [unclassified Sulfurimonas]|uniref:hypothetical protein n=1 Tax=unclassified Sulfurimonas TaxID=2623549 RepID=UPI0008CE222C|nr:MULTISPECIES: hypothetical protein [unclassified Sulfurimonas]OHE14591.1 MAG: hypothetical protein A2530_01650 [Sulfurimonas sp. RIFOXYD2_FULL_34_21]